MWPEPEPPTDADQFTWDELNGFIGPARRLQLEAKERVDLRKEIRRRAPHLVGQMFGLKTAVELRALRDTIDQYDGNPAWGQF